MDSKDLFNAIDIAAEDYVSDLPDNTEGIRPIVLHADKKPLSLAKRIAVAAAACAAVAAVGVGVTVGVKNHSQRGFIVSGDVGAGNSERNFAPAADILRIRDVGFYCEGMSDQTREDLEDCFKDPTPVDMFDHLLKDGLLFPEAPQVYFYNGIALDKRMLSTEADEWLFRYCLTSERDRRDMTPPDEVKYLTEGGLVRFEDVGYLRDKYTEHVLEECKISCDQYRELNFYSSRIPLMPDVYYYNDVPYNIDQLWSEDTKNWLDWFCWLKEEDQAQLSGYAPEQMTADIVLKSVPIQFGVYRYPNDTTDKDKDERPHEIVTYKGKEIDVRDVSPDTEKFIKWYNTLSEELKAKVVWYEPQELSKFAGEEIMWNGREIIRFGDVGYYTDLYSEEEMAAIKAYHHHGQMLNSVPLSPDVHFFNDTPYDTDKLSDDTLSWLGWYYYSSGIVNDPMGYVPGELIAPTEPLVRAEVYYFRGLPIKESELSDETIRWLNWFNALSEEERSYQYGSEVFYVPSDLSEYKKIRNPIPEGADPDDPLPCGLTGIDNVKLTYRDAAYAVIYSNEDSVDLNKLEPGTVLIFDFVYLAEPGSSEFKRYKPGDSFYGMTVQRAEATFTLENGGTASYQGDVWLSGSLTVDAYMVLENADNAYSNNCNAYKGAADGLPHIGFSRDKDSGEAVPFDYTINRLINSGENYMAAPGSITTDKDETLPLNTTFKITLNNLHLWGSDSSQTRFDATAAMSD